MIARNKGTGREWLAATALAGIILAAVLVAYFPRGLGGPAGNLLCQDKGLNRAERCFEFNWRL